MLGMRLGQGLQARAGNFKYDLTIGQDRSAGAQAQHWVLYDYIFICK